MAKKILEIKDLYVEYKTMEKRVYAVNGVDLSLDEGETLGLVGETGAGKTTTALSVMGLLPDHIGEVTEGEIILDGIDVLHAKEADMRLLRGTAASMIFQDPMSSLNPVLTIGDQILEILKLHNTENLTKEQLDQSVDEIMKMVGIPSERKREYPHQFSGGMKQRVVIAIALACKPKLILADEPTTALDVTIQAQVLTMMLELQKQINTAMVIITHDLGIIAQTCKKVAVMYGGVIVEFGTVEHIFDSGKRHPYTQGLFDSIPKLDEETDRLIPIEGQVADPTVKRVCCPFKDRCKCSSAVCEYQPQMIEVEEGHFIRCHMFREGGE